MSATVLCIRKATAFSEVHCQASFSVLFSRTGLCVPLVVRRPVSGFQPFSGGGKGEALGNDVTLATQQCLPQNLVISVINVCISVLNQISRRDDSLSRGQIENLAHNHPLKFSPVEFILKLQPFVWSQEY